MFVQLICKERNAKEMDEIYQVLGALCEREGVQIEDRSHAVEILVCPQGKIVVREDENDLILSANTRHGGPGFHAFVVDFFEDIEEEIPGDYELIDDTEYDKDEDFDRLVQKYEDELDYVRKLILDRPGFSDKNYMFDETYYLPKTKQGRVNTATGDMDLSEFQTKDLKKLMDRFYVWNNWDRDGRFYRNSALTLLAKEGYGEFSKMNEKTEKVAETICDDLEVAFRLDPTMPLPLKAYRRLCELLNRDDRLKGAIDMKGDVNPYRLGEVYHIFEDAKVVALGTAQRTYDPVTRSVFLSAPYKGDHEWSWLIQASLQPGILPDLDTVMEQEPITTDEGTVVWMDEYIEDDVHYIDAVIREDERYLYIHALAKDAKLSEYLRKCILESGFYNA